MYKLNVIFSDYYFNFTPKYYFKFLFLIYGKQADSSPIEDAPIGVCNTRGVTL